jgi:hypothetical protein
MDDHKPERYGGHKHRDAKALLAGVCTAGLVAALLTACSGSNRTLFQSNFNATPVGQPPAQNQPVGTVSAFGQSKGVFVNNPAPGSTGSDDWVVIGRSGDNQPVTGMVCKLSQTVGLGKYNFTAAIFMPSVGNNVASISFLSQADLTGSGEGPNWDGFVHVDLMQDNTIRINDTVSTKVTFTRAHPFDLSVNLDTTQATASTNPTATATVDTLGAATPLEKATYAIPLNPPSSGNGPSPDASQFAAVVLWMGFPWTGYFEATEIAVTNNT